MKKINEVYRERISEYAKRRGAGPHYIEGVWDVPCNVAMPAVPQNERTGKDAKTLVSNGVIFVGEGVNMPTTPQAVRLF